MHHSLKIMVMIMTIAVSCSAFANKTKTCLKNLKAASGHLKRDEVLMITKYTGREGHRTINQILRSFNGVPPAEDQKAIGFDKAFFDELSVQLKKVPMIKATVFRGFGSNEPLRYETSADDSFIIDHGFSSFSLNRDKAYSYMISSLPAFKYKYLIEARVRSGRNITLFSQIRDDQEILLLPGVRLKIESVETEVDSYGVQYEHIKTSEFRDE